RRASDLALAVLQGSVPLALGEDVKEFIIIFPGGNTEYVLEVFGGGPDQGNAPDIDFFNDVRFRGPTGHGLFEGVEVDDHQVQLGNVELLDLGGVPGMATTVQDASEDLGVKGLYPTPQDGGIPGDLLHGDDLDPKVPDKGLGAPGGIKDHAQPVQFFY